MLKRLQAFLLKQQKSTYDHGRMTQKMAILFLKIFQCLVKRPPPRAKGRQHLILSGISQTSFLKNWGIPDARILLRRLGNLQQGTLYLRVDSEEDAHYSVWIYKEKDRVFFFAKKKLIVHFKWSGFHERRKQMKEETGVHGMRNSPALVVKTPAFFA